MRLQNVATRDWDLKGTVERLRYADDGRVVSYSIMTDRNHLTTRHRRFLKPLHVDHDPKLVTNKNIDTENYATNIADLPTAVSVAPRRSGRLKPSTTQAIKRITMGAEFSTPFTANIELNFGGNDDVVTVREVSRRSVQNRGMANRPQQLGAQAERPAGGGAHPRHPGQAVVCVNRTGENAANGGSQQRHQGQEDLGGATGRSLNDGRLKARKQNVAFFKAGNCHKQGIAGQKRRHDVSLGSCRLAPARGGQAEQGNITETITLNSDSSDNESLQEMEERLARMLERKFKRKRGHKSLE